MLARFLKRARSGSYNLTALDDVAPGIMPNTHNSGHLVFHGRRDHMVKIRGQSAELFEIESGVLVIPELRRGLLSFLATVWTLSERLPRNSTNIVPARYLATWYRRRLGSGRHRRAPIRRSVSSRGSGRCVMAVIGYHWPEPLWNYTKQARLHLPRYPLPSLRKPGDHQVGRDLALSASSR